MTELGKLRQSINAPRVTRVEVIDATGRAFVRYYETAGVEIAFQDDHRTVKLFAGDPAAEGTGQPTNHEIRGQDT